MATTYYAVEETLSSGWTLLDYDTDTAALAARVKEMCQRENGGLWAGRFAGIQFATRTGLRRRYRKRDWEIDIEVHQIDEDRKRAADTLDS